jgi:hypothetical protein
MRSFDRRFKERLLRCVQIGAMKYRPAGYRAHCKRLNLGPLIADIDPGLTPANLSFLC